MASRLPKFGTAIVDPPWPYMRTSSSDKLTGYSDKQYESLSIADLSSLPVGEVTSNVLLLWTTAPMMIDALNLVADWGFDYITQLYWVKSSDEPERIGNRVTTFRPSYGVGYWFRGNCEPIIVAKKKRSPSWRTNLPSTFYAKRLGHSRKPDFLHEVAEAFFPGPYLELFARTRRDGWSQLGDELEGDGRDIRQSLSIMEERRG